MNTFLKLRHQSREQSSIELESDRKINTGTRRSECRNRFWLFWAGIVIVGVEVFFLFSPYRPVLGGWSAQVFLGIVLELLIVIFVLVRLDGPLLIVQSPFRDALVIHDRSFKSSNIKPVARKIQSQLPRWLDNGYKEVSMRSHLFGGKSEDKLIKMALRLSRQCDETPHIFVFKKHDFVTWLNKVWLRIFKIFRPSILVREQDGGIIFSRRNLADTDPGLRRLRVTWPEPKQP